MTNSISPAVEKLQSADAAVRAAGAAELYRLGSEAAAQATSSWRTDRELSALLALEHHAVTVGVAVRRESFAKIHAMNGAPRPAEVPPDQDAEEFELHFPGGIALDVLTTKDPRGGGAIAKFLEKFGEGVQQVEYPCSNVDRATEILRERFGLKPVYPATRPGAGGTRINFFLVPSNAGKVLIELYENAV